MEQNEQKFNLTKTDQQFDHDNWFPNAVTQNHETARTENLSNTGCKQIGET